MATTEDSSSARSRYRRETKVLSYLSAAWCGILLIVVGALMTAVNGAQTLRVLTERVVSAGNFVGQLLAIGLFGSLIVFVLGLAFGRFLLRTLPPHFSNQARRPRFQALCAIALCVPFVALFILSIVLASVLSANKAASTSIPSDGAVTLLGNLVVAVVPFALLWASGAIGPLVLRYRKPRVFLDKPFVLFLRRFSTFSDRAVIALVLKQVAPGVPVVFLTPTSSRPGDWDPFVVGFAGLKLLHPWLSVPIVLRARDDDWQRAADELIRRARTIMLDTSETSIALRTEAEMIEKADRWSDTVFLRLLHRDSGSVVDLSCDTRAACAIDYKKSWVRALPRMLIGFITMLLAAMWAYIIAAFLLSSGLLNWLLPLIVIAAAFVYFSVFVRPTINREARVALRTVLRAGK